MSVTYLIHLHVRPGQLDRFTALLSGVLDEMRHESSFRSATLLQNPEDPLHFLLHETWADHDDVVNVQLERPYRAEWHAALAELLSRPRDVSIWQPLRADGSTI